MGLFVLGCCLIVFVSYEFEVGRYCGDNLWQVVVVGLGGFARFCCGILGLVFVSFELWYGCGSVVISGLDTFSGWFRMFLVKGYLCLWFAVGRRLL